MEQLVKPISIALKAVKDGPPSSSQPHAFLRIVWKRASIIAVSRPLSINLAQFGLRGGAFKARNTNNAYQGIRACKISGFVCIQGS